jgi:RNA polymerase sigma factor (sigma-70 family)
VSRVNVAHEKGPAADPIESLGRLALLESHRPRLAHWVRKWLGMRADAWIGVEDILQDVLWSAWRTQAMVRSDDPNVVRSWLFRIARNRVREHARRHARRNERRGLEMEERGAALEELADRDCACPEIVAEAHTVTRAAIGSLVHLDGAERMALVLRELLDAPWETTAFLLERPSYRAARSAIARARSSLDRAPLERA